MKTLYHFGDSYGYTDFKEPHYVELLSNKLNYRYENSNTILPGGSNEMLFHRLLKKIYEFNSGDILFFNFSYFIRGCFYDPVEKEIKSTNKFFYDGVDMKGIINTKDKHIVDTITYLMDYTEDYNRRLFHQFDLIFEQLMDRQIKIYHIFNENSQWSDDLIKHSKNIKFDVGYNQWLLDKGFHKHECCHYTHGVQHLILDYIQSIVSFM